MFLLRMAFWLSLVILLLPSGRGESSDAESPAPDAELSTGRAWGFASAALSDLYGFCQRNPEACATGSRAIAAFGQKAQESARSLFDYLADLDPAHISIGSPTGDPASSPGDTLQPEDLDVPWRGPDIRG